MSEPERTADRRTTGESPQERRRRLDAVFGDVLPETTSDERDPDQGRDSSDGGDAWLRSQVPPHHGG